MKEALNTTATRKTGMGKLPGTWGTVIQWQKPWLQPSDGPIPIHFLADITCNDPNFQKKTLIGLAWVMCLLPKPHPLVSWVSQSISHQGNRVQEAQSPITWMLDREICPLHSLGRERRRTLYFVPLFLYLLVTSSHFLHTALKHSERPVFLLQSPSADMRICLSENPKKSFWVESFYHKTWYC